MTLRPRPEAQAKLDRVVSAWRLSPATDQFEQPADEPMIAAAEQAMGRPIPETLKVLYRISNGMSVSGGNLSIEPLRWSDEFDPRGSAAVERIPVDPWSDRRGARTRNVLARLARRLATTHPA